MNDTPVVLWQMRPVWGLPNPSPFCMKVETWLRMVRIPYIANALSGPPKSQSKKVPYIERPDGSLLSDSSVIIETLTREHGVGLDDHLSDSDRAVGVLMQRCFEEELYFIVLHERWVIDENWKLVEPAYFGEAPWLLRKVFAPVVRRKVTGYAHGQGVSRLSHSERIRKGRADLQAIAQVLGDKEYLLGRPSSFDAVAYAFLANILFAPIPSALADAAREIGSLLEYCERLKAAYFGDWTPA